MSDALKYLTAKQIAAICGVDLATARRWRRQAICPPRSALILLEMVYSGDLGLLDPAWKGWVLRRGVLCSPENWTCTPGDVRAIQFHEAQIAVYRAENRQLKASLTERQYEDQPTPEQWEYVIATSR